MINTMAKSKLERKISFLPSGYGPLSRESKVGNQAEVEEKKETLNLLCLLCLPGSHTGGFLVQHRSTCQGIAQLRWDWYSSINHHQGNATQTFPGGNVLKAITQLRLLQLTVGYIKLRSNANCDRRYS